MKRLVVLLASLSLATTACLSDNVQDYKPLLLHVEVNLGNPIQAIEEELAKDRDRKLTEQNQILEEAETQLREAKEALENAEEFTSEQVAEIGLMEEEVNSLKEEVKDNKQAIWDEYFNNTVGLNNLIKLSSTFKGERDTREECLGITKYPTSIEENAYFTLCPTRPTNDIRNDFAVFTVAYHCNINDECKKPSPLLTFACIDMNARHPEYKVSTCSFLPYKKADYQHELATIDSDVHHKWTTKLLEPIHDVDLEGGKGFVFQMFVPNNSLETNSVGQCELNTTDKETVTCKIKADDVRAHMRKLVIRTFRSIPDNAELRAISESAELDVPQAEEVSCPDGQAPDASGNCVDQNDQEDEPEEGDACELVSCRAGERCDSATGRCVTGGSGGGGGGGTGGGYHSLPPPTGGQSSSGSSGSGSSSSGSSKKSGGFCNMSLNPIDAGWEYLFFIALLVGLWVSRKKFTS